MISEKTKAQAIARLTHKAPIDEVAAEFDLPLMLVKEWKDKLSGQELLRLESNVHAVGEVLSGEIVPGQEEVLKFKLESAATEIAVQAVKCAPTGDMIHAKALQLLADGVSKLYATLVLKSGAIDGNPRKGAINAPSAFHDLMRD